MSIIEKRSPELFVNTFAADGKYPVLNRENLTITIQIRLSKKKTFSRFFLHFPKSRINFERNGSEHC